MEDTGNGLTLGNQLQVLPGDHPQCDDQHGVYRHRRADGAQGRQGRPGVARGQDATEQAVARPGGCPHGGGGQNGLGKDCQIVGLFLQHMADDGQVHQGDEAVADQGGEGGMDPTVITGVIQSLKGMSGAEVKQLLASLLTEMGGDSILSKLDITKISDADMEKLMGYVFNGFPLVHRIDNANFEDGQTLENMYVSVDKELFDILMPAVFPLLPDLETMLADMQIEIFGQSAPLLPLLKGLLGIQSLTEFEQIWEATSSFDIGLDLAVGSFSEFIKPQSSK